MSYFLWDDKYAFGIDSIDEDHKVLVSLINQLYVAMSQGKARAVISGIVTQMVDYAKVHFRREEFFFKGISYTESAEHKAEHDAFSNRVADFKTELDAGNVGISIEVISFLREWLTNHILVSDKKYVAAFKKFGIK
ncbi:MAG: hemerythrin family protein [Bacteroidales bacterium]|nr:hemerythrin family protein [Bacteroidales bacterium]MBN2749326.1 hemerythrin family protein [Bacteroidales bacterium]